MTLTDRVIGAISPEWGLRRLRARAQLEQLEHGLSRLSRRNSYEGADRGRRTQGWVTVDSSAQAATRGSLETLRARCRALRRNNEWAASAVREISSNLIGRGVRPKFQHDQDSELRIAEEIWAEWAESTQCDASGRDNFYGLQAAAVESFVDGGECLIRQRLRRIEDRLAVPLQLQTLEGDHLDTFRDGETTPTGGRVVQGVQYNALGQREGYWLLREHPGDTFYIGRPRESVFVPARTTSHVFRLDRIGQVRGVAWGAPAILRLHNFGSYEDAEAVRMTVAASFSGYVRDLTPDASFSPSKMAAAQSSISGTNEKDQPIDEIEAGTIEYLPPGKTIEFPNLPQNNGFSSYATWQLRAVAKGYGVPYWLLTGDFSGVNFATIRADWVGFSRAVDQCRQRTVVTHVCDPAVRAFRDAAEISGKLRAPSKTGSRLAWSWMDPRREMLDPRTEVMAEIASVRAGFKSVSQVVQGLGFDPETVHRQLSKDLELARSLGLLLSTDGTVPEPGKVNGVNSQGDEAAGERAERDVLRLLRARGISPADMARALVAVPTVENGHAVSQTPGA